MQATRKSASIASPEIHTELIAFGAGSTSEKIGGAVAVVPAQNVAINFCTMLFVLFSSRFCSIMAATLRCLRLIAPEKEKKKKKERIADKKARKKAELPLQRKTVAELRSRESERNKDGKRQRTMKTPFGFFFWAPLICKYFGFN